MTDYEKYRKWLNKVNPQTEDDAKEISDMRMKVFKPLMSDTVIPRMIGLNLATNGIIDRSLVDYVAINGLLGEMFN